MTNCYLKIYKITVHASTLSQLIVHQLTLLYIWWIDQVWDHPFFDNFLSLRPPFFRCSSFFLSGRKAKMLWANPFQLGWRYRKGQCEKKFVTAFIPWPENKNHCNDFKITRAKNLEKLALTYNWSIHLAKILSVKQLTRLKVRHFLKMAYSRLIFTA